MRRDPATGFAGVRAGESIAAHQAVRDAERYATFTRESLSAAEAEIVAAKALKAASGAGHLPVLNHAIDQRIEAAADLDRTLLAVEPARAKYIDAGELAALVNLHGAQHPHQPTLANGPYARRPGEHEAAERAAWGPQRSERRPKNGHEGDSFPIRRRRDRNLGA